MFGLENKEVEMRTLRRIKEFFFGRRETRDAIVNFKTEAEMRHSLPKYVLFYGIGLLPNPISGIIAGCSSVFGKTITLRYIHKTKNWGFIDCSNGKIISMGQIEPHKESKMYDFVRYVDEYYLEEN